MTCSISARGQQGVERRHRGAVQAVVDRPAQVVAVGGLPLGVEVNLKIPLR